MPPEDFNEKIELLVNDENRIVTYKILSQELKIHVNKAKQCLSDFLNVQKSKGFSLDVHYFLAGFVEKDGIRSVKVAIVPEEKLEDAKKNYIEITSFHVYSIYKGTANDECALYSADFTYTKDRDQLNKYSAIKHPNIEIQPPFLNKISIKNDARLPAKNDAKSSIPQKVEPNAPVNGNLPNDAAKSKSNENSVSPRKNDTSAENQSKTSKKISPEDKKAKSGTLMSMWQKKDEKQNGAKKESTKTESKSTKPVPKNNILSMFSKQAVKNAEKPPALKSVESKEDSSPKSDLPNVKEDVVKEIKTGGGKKSSQKRKASNNTSKKSKSSKSLQDSDSDSEFQPKSKKKHKRICTFDDSDSESENEEEKEKAQRSFFQPEEPTDAVPATPVTDDEDPIPPTPPIINVKGKAKIWKTVQKTYEDEEGFFVTKTEKELVSVSEDEEDPIKVQPPKKEEIVKKTSSVNKKQASLMSFFKQK